MVTLCLAAFSGDLDPSLLFFPGDADLALAMAAPSSISISSSTLFMAALMVWIRISFLPNVLTHRYIISHGLMVDIFL